MPYLTPQNLPEDGDCRPLSIPASSEWLALFGGALTELTKRWNWEYSGGLTIDETIDKMTEIIDNWYTVPCTSCTLPGGGRIIRIGAHGVLEELGDDGEWTDPTGDYIIPPPDARTGGTEADQICLAAKNAVNVLQQLYETLAEQWASHVSEAEALTEFTLAAIGLVGFEFAPITFAVVAFFGVAFAALYTALEYLGADLWDEAFSSQLTCFLVECAMNDAGVVTFDWDCLMSKLNSLTDSFGLSEIQLRLYLQVTYILYFIGGVDGLNLAARTTEITNDDCSFCDDSCHEWTDVGSPSVDGTYVYRTFASSLSPFVAFTEIEVEYTLNPNPGGVDTYKHLLVSFNGSGTPTDDVTLTSDHDTILLTYPTSPLRTAFNITVQHSHSTGANYPDLNLVRVRYLPDAGVSWVGGSDCIE